MRLLDPGQTHDYQREPIPCTAEIDGAFYFLVKAICENCGSSHTLFDKEFHGWDGFVCHEAGQAARPPPPLEEWECLTCGGKRHTARIALEAQGKQDFIEEAGDEFPVDRWPDAFGWFDKSIACTECGKATATWVSYETM